MNDLWSVAAPTSGAVPSVLDVDSHFPEPADWLNSVDLKLAKACPGRALLLGTAAFAGVDALQPPSTPFWSGLTEWADCSTIADIGSLVEDSRTSTFLSVEHFDAPARVAWLDRVGVDHQVCNPSQAAHLAAGAAAIDPKLGRSVADAFNHWAGEAVHGHRDRLHPAGLIDLSEAHGALSDLERLAANGGITFLMPLDHAAWDHVMTPEFAAFWEAVERLGVMPSMHLGIGPKRHPLLSSAAAWAAMQVDAQRCLLAWVGSPYAASHPGVSVLVQELGVDWAPPWLRSLDRAIGTPVVQMLGGPHPSSRSIAEVAETQVLWVPLPRDPVRATLADREVPMAFGSDHPHGEGWGNDPVAAFKRCLADQTLAERVLSASLERPVRNTRAGCEM